MRLVKWGILSTARINRRLIPEIQASPRSQLIAVASRNEERGRQYAEEWAIPRVHSDYEDLIEDPEIDVVYIPLPNDLHAEWTIRALRAGKHVLCEKPLCLTIAELDSIRQASRETGRHVMEAFMYVHHPQTDFFHEIVRSDELGEIVAMSGEFMATFNRPSDNYRMNAAQGGGALWDLGVYPVSFFCGLDSTDVRRVAGMARRGGGVDVTFWGRMDFASGVSGQFTVSFESEYSTHTSIMGTKARLEITHPYNAAHECRAWISAGGIRRELDVPKASLYSGEIENMNDIVLNIAQPRFSLTESERVLRAILELQQAALF